MAFVATWDSQTPALVVAAVATVSLGLLVGRWWAVVVPLALGLPVSGLLLIGQSHELDMVALAGVTLLWTMRITALVAIGVGVERGVRALIQPARRRARPHNKRHVPGGSWTSLRPPSRPWLRLHRRPTPTVLGRSVSGGPFRSWFGHPA